MSFWESRFNFRTHIRTWPNSKLWKSPGHSGKLSLPWNWNQTWMWSWTSCWELHFTFWFKMTPVSLPDFFSIPESTLNPVPVHCEIESPISYDHTMEKVCEHQFFGLDPIFEPISTLIVDSRLDLSQLPESVSVFLPIPFKSKSIIFKNHTSLLDKNVDKSDSVIIFEN